MRNKQSLVDERRKNLYHIIADNPKKSITELSSDMHVAQITIRRDMAWLQEQKLIELFYGGYRIINTETENKTEEPLETIARFAASIIEDNDVVFIDASSAALAVVKYIKAENVIVITNNAGIINTEYPYRLRVFLTTGEIRAHGTCLVGNYTAEVFRRNHANKCFLGCSGIMDENTITTTNMDAEIINNEIIKSSDKNFLLAGFNQFNVKANFKCFDEKLLQNIITDKNAPERILENFAKNGVSVYRAENGEIYKKP